MELVEPRRRPKFFFTFIALFLFILLPVIFFSPTNLPITIAIVLLSSVVAVMLPTNKKKYYIPISLLIASTPFALILAYFVISAYLQT